VLESRLRRRGALWLTTVLLALAACRSDQVTNVPAATPSSPGLVTPRQTLSSLTGPLEGICTRTLPTYDNGNVPSYDIGCPFPDSVLVRVTVSGMTTVVPNPGHTCCFQDIDYKKAGTYGPAGGGTVDNWMAMQVRSTIKFNDSTQTGGVAGPLGSMASTVQIWEGSSNGRGGGRVRMERYGALANGSC
jgi:hypothetical protein